MSAQTTKGDGTMSAEIRDPISRVRQTFSIEGESLVVDNWLDPGRKLPPHYHPQQEERWSVVDGRVRPRTPTAVVRKASSLVDSDSWRKLRGGPLWTLTGAGGDLVDCRPDSPVLRRSAIEALWQAGR